MDLTSMLNFAFGSVCAPVDWEKKMEFDRRKDAHFAITAQEQNERQKRLSAWAASEAQRLKNLEDDSDSSPPNTRNKE